jgi:hypothetical protein
MGKAASGGLKAISGGAKPESRPSEGDPKKEAQANPS